MNKSAVMNHKIGTGWVSGVYFRQDALTALAGFISALLCMGNS
jgi:hypothetical protein